MNVVSLEFSPPPLPSSIQNGFGLMYHPEERSLWMLAFRHHELWRFQHNVWTRIAKGEALFPPSYSALYSWNYYFYWDTGRKAPVFFATGYGGTEKPVLGVWLENSFQEVSLEDALKSSCRDAFAFDPERQCLVHFVRKKDIDEADGKYARGLQVRELDISNRWRDVGNPLPADGAVDSMAGYDGRSKTTIYIDSDGWSAEWNGIRLQKHQQTSVYPWFPYATSLAPRTRSMVYLHHKRSNHEFDARILELHATGFVETKKSQVEACGAMAYDSHNDVTYVYGPWFGSGRLQYLLTPVLD